MSCSDTNTDDDSPYNSECSRIVEFDQETETYVSKLCKDSKRTLPFIRRTHDVSTSDESTESIPSDPISETSDQPNEGLRPKCTKEYQTMSKFSRKKLRERKEFKLEILKDRYKEFEIDYTFPQDAYLPNDDWRMYPIRDNICDKPWFINKFPTYLIGRHRKVFFSFEILLADIPTDHPTCSNKHAVLQYRRVPSEEKPNEYVILLYLIDIGSTNGTFINREKIEPKTFYQINNKDVVKFGKSKREYVFIKVEYEK